MKKIHLIIFIFIFSAVNATALAAEDVYQSPTDFITETFDGNAPSKKMLIIDAALKEKIEKIMGQHYKLSQTPFWQKDGRTAWILEAIGKYEPITTGFVVDADGTLERVKVLIYRESHGWEVKHKFFTKQFKNAGLKREKKLDKRIDGIAGATLSVDALKKLGALALTLHKSASET